MRPILRSLPMLALTACVVSGDAVITEEAAVFDPGLLGRWEKVDGGEEAVVSEGPGASYAIRYTTDGNTGTFRARLGQLDGHQVLDVWPAPAEGELPDSYGSLMIAGHLAVIVERSGPDEIRLSALEPDTLLDALRSGAVVLSYSETSNSLVLRGPTAELRSALGPVLDRPGALGEPDVWRRVPADEGWAGPVEPPCFEPAPWPEADRLFRGDPHWRGGDVASSVALGEGRTLWLFGDSWINAAGAGTREGATMVSNSVAVQRGTDPSTASITFYWGRAPDGGPAAVIPDRGGERLWFGSGVRVRDRLVLFLARTIRTRRGLGFEHVGPAAFLVDNPDDEPSEWRTRELSMPPDPLGVLLGFAASFQQGDHVYALGTPATQHSHPIFAARWPTDAVRRGDLSEPEWWAGPRHGWVPDSSTTPRAPIFEDAQTELTVHFDTTSRRFLAVHTRGFGPADLVMRAAPSLTGPWSGPRPLFRPPEYYRPHIMIYAGKAHPRLTGADLVLTYATNTFDWREAIRDTNVYFPRFVRLTRCEGG